MGAALRVERAGTVLNGRERTRADLQEPYFRRSAQSRSHSSHRRGHWFDPSIAHSVFYLVRWPADGFHRQAVCVGVGANLPLDQADAPGREALNNLFAAEPRKAGRPMKLPFAVLVIPPSLKKKLIPHLESTATAATGSCFRT